MRFMQFEELQRLQDFFGWNFMKSCKFFDPYINFQVSNPYRKNYVFLLEELTTKISAFNSKYRSKNWIENLIVLNSNKLGVKLPNVFIHFHKSQWLQPKDGLGYGLIFLNILSFKKIVLKLGWISWEKPGFLVEFR
jgi:hypothetical protein